MRVEVKVALDVAPVDPEEERSQENYIRIRVGTDAVLRVLRAAEANGALRDDESEEIVSLLGVTGIGD